MAGTGGQREDREHLWDGVRAICSSPAHLPSVVGFPLLFAAVIVAVSGVSAGSLVGVLAETLFVFGVVLALFGPRLAADAFAARYAAARQLRWEVEGDLPFGTWLLDRNRDATAPHSLMSGALSGGPEGIVCFFEVARSPGVLRAIRAPLTVAVYDISAARGVDGLVCTPRASDGKRGRLPSRVRRVELDDEQFSALYEIGVRGESDAPLAEQIFAPDFRAWMAGVAEGSDMACALSFELSEGTLCVSVPGRRTTTSSLDDFVGRSVRIASKVSDLDAFVAEAAQEA
ncbi:MAG TPA: hypothetical protein VGM80_11435 [Gaiellaceae bacterium]